MARSVGSFSVPAEKCGLETRGVPALMSAGGDLKV